MRLDKKDLEVLLKILRKNYLLLAAADEVIISAEPVAPKKKTQHPLIFYRGVLTVIVGKKKYVFKTKTESYPKPEWAERRIQRKIEEIINFDKMITIYEEAKK